MDYISRETAKHDIVAWAQVITQPDLLSRDDALTALDCIPAADVREVVRAKWIPISDQSFVYGDFRCSNCGHDVCDVNLVRVKPGRNCLYYCPNCGAVMGGQDNA